MVDDFVNHFSCTNLQDKRHIVDCLKSGEYVIASFYDDSDDDLKYIEEKAERVYEYSILMVYRVK